MLDGQLGVERDVVHLRTLKSLPVVPWTSLTRLEQRSVRELSRRLRRGFDSVLQADINAFVARLHGLSDVQRDAVAETISTGLTTKKAREEALRLTTPRDREEFVEVCQHGLRDVLSASGMTARVLNRDDLWSSRVPWRFVQVDRVREGRGARGLARLRIADFVGAADTGAASLIMLRTSKETTLVGLLDRFRYWTRTRARLLASELLAEGMMAESGIHTWSTCWRASTGEPASSRRSGPRPWSSHAMIGRRRSRLVSTSSSPMFG